MHPSSWLKAHCSLFSFQTPCSRESLAFPIRVLSRTVREQEPHCSDQLWAPRDSQNHTPLLNPQRRQGVPYTQATMAANMYVQIREHRGCSPQQQRHEEVPLTSQGRGREGLLSHSGQLGFSTEALPGPCKHSPPECSSYGVGFARDLFEGSHGQHLLGIHLPLYPADREDGETR